MKFKLTKLPKFRKGAGSGTTPPAPSRRNALYNQCKALANSPDILAALRSALRERGIVGALQNFLIVYLAVITRLFDHPTSVVLKGVSSAGKSAVPDAVLSFCPPSAFHILTSMSDKALFYARLSSKWPTRLPASSTGQAVHSGQNICGRHRRSASPG